MNRILAGVEVSVETSGPHLVPVLGLSADPPSAEELMRARPRLLSQLERRIEVHSTRGRCTSEATGYQLTRAAGEHVVRATLRFSCPPGPLTLHNEWRLDVDPQSEVLCAVDGRAHVFRLGHEALELAAPDTLTDTLARFVGLGVIHVLSGLDHMLFLVALLLSAACRGSRQALRHGLSHMALVISGFTLGHSLTLVSAGLGVVSLNARVTESIIALSLVVVACENIALSEPRWRAGTAALFGLVHGFGFASVLGEIQLPRGALVECLVAFNLGIELAQLMLALLLFPLLRWAARRPWYRSKLLVSGSAGIAVLGGLWFIKRAFDLRFWPWLGA